MSLQRKENKNGRFISATQEDVIRRFREVHGDRYDYSKVIYVRSQSKVLIICREHGEFEQTANHHERGHGCKKCALIYSASKRDYKALGVRLSLTTMKDKEWFITRATEVHGVYYDYTDVIYTGYHNKVSIKCPTHGTFHQAPSKHIHARRGCIKCSNQTSKIADHWLNDIAVPIREHRLPERKLRVVDGYDPATRTIYQFHGDFFHGNPEVYEADNINPLTKRTFGESYDLTMKRDQELRDLGYNLVIMWESDYVKSVGKKKAYEG